VNNPSQSLYGEVGVYSICEGRWGFMGWFFQAVWYWVDWLSGGRGFFRLKPGCMVGLPFGLIMSFEPFGESVEAREENPFCQVCLVEFIAYFPF